MIRSGHMKSCLTAQICFMLFKGPGSFKKIFKIGGNVDELKGYRLIPLTRPLFFHFTLPLYQNRYGTLSMLRNCNCISCYYRVILSTKYLRIIVFVRLRLSK
jgi:hypothetical protein